LGDPMAERSNISWTHHTQNFWMGCDKIAPECAHCYIDRAMIKLGREPWGSIYRTSDALWKNPAKWERKAAARGKALRIFTCSESDFFHDKADPWRPEAWAIIRGTPHLNYQILTKRPGRIISHLPPDWGTGYSNCWLGVTAGCKKSLGLLDVLRKVPAVVRFVSAEPLLEDISPDISLESFQWLITGGESGPAPEYVWPGTKWQDEQAKGRRKMKLEWAGNLLEKCQRSEVAYYFKQVTAFRSGERSDALGRLYHDCPAGTFPWYTEAELDVDFPKTRKVAAPPSNQSELQPAIEFEQ
jgi:protein gp37